MIAIDTNILVYARRRESACHEPARKLLTRLAEGSEPWALPWPCVYEVLRVVTHPRVFNSPTPIEVALKFTEAIRSRPNCVPVAPGRRHWEIFARLCTVAGVKGNLVPDAYLAALAIESGSEWITTDRDYSRFPHLKWRHPLGQ